MLLSSLNTFEHYLAPRKGLRGGVKVVDCRGEVVQRTLSACKSLFT
jgi:hypothetical protein